MMTPLIIGVAFLLTDGVVGTISYRRRKDAGIAA